MEKEYYDKSTGYIYLKRPEHPRGQKRGGLIAKHVLVAEESLGRFLNDGEIVHHKDHNKLNNTPDNLEVMTQAEHARLHKPETKFIVLICDHCGQEFRKRYNQYTTKFSNGQRTFYCNRTCMSAGFRRAAEIS